MWTSVGAVASLYDASCFVSVPTTSFAYLTGALKPLIDHFFVAAPNGAAGVDPRFNLIGTSEYSILARAGVRSVDLLLLSEIIVMVAGMRTNFILSFWCIGPRVAQWNGQCRLAPAL